MPLVTVGCKLPNGLRLNLDGHSDVIINGLNKSKILGADVVYTEVDEAFWQSWAEKHKGYPPLVSGALFVAKSEREAEAKAKDLRGKKTGLEPMPQKASGIDKDDGQ